MATFAARMLAAKQSKLDRRNRGESIGNHRGTLNVRPLYQPEDWLDLEICRIVQSIADVQRGLAADLDWAVCEINGVDDVPF